MQEKEKKETYVITSNQYFRLKEIELNKRPPGTRMLDDFERKEMLRKLKSEEANLQRQIEKVCISQHTERAKNEYKGLD